MKRIKRIICVVLAAIMVFVSMGEPVTTEAATLPYYIRINRRQNCVTIYKMDSKGNYSIPVKAMVCSTGVNNATPLGTFTLSSKYRWHQLMGDVYGQYCSRITGGVLFHSVYYSEPDPGKLAYNSYNRLGQAASHGCVRLNVADAKWIYDNCPSGTKINIYDGDDPGPLGKPSPVRIDVSSPYRGWDPTDPNENNPWQKMKPTIKGIKNKTVERCSKTPDMKKGVTATDYKGNKLKVKVTGTCNTKKAGKYKITYQATDSKGSTTKKTVTVTVKDTKKPIVKMKKKTVTVKGELSKSKLLSKLKQNINATDSGEKLSSKYVTIKADKLLAAMKQKKYGTYKVTVYAKDKAGNISVKHTFKVKYVNPNPEPEEPTEPTEPEEPTEPTESTEPINPTEPVEPTEPIEPTEPTESTEPIVPEEPAE